VSRPAGARRRRGSRSAAAEHRGVDVDAREAKPITAAERRGRIEKARRLMAEQKIDAIILAGGTSLNYFTGIRWGNSERLTAVVIPRVGNPSSSRRRSKRSDARATRRRTSRTHGRRDLAGGRESVRARRAGPEGPRHRHRRIGVEETTKFVFADSMGDAAPALKVVSATPITAGCRMIKDPHGSS
jgi:Xaa-Pro dipeptidase